MTIKIAINKHKGLNILGINSGTSGDGLDMALVRFEFGRHPEVIAADTYVYDKRFSSRIIAAGERKYNDGQGWLNLDARLGDMIGKMAASFIAGLAKKGHKVDLITSHGQTVRHLPDGKGHTITYQVGDASIISALNKLPVVSDFRRSDTAAGGQGAPLSPILHEYLFRHRTRWRAILNIGGIANITVLPPTNSVKCAFASDCGPGNMLINLASQKFLGKPFDKDGRAAITGMPDVKSISRLMKMPFFKKLPPKSTGRELFGSDLFKQFITQFRGRDKFEIISTLSEFTVTAISDFILHYCPMIKELYCCGGGAHNNYLLRRLSERFPDIFIETTSCLDYDPDYLEAVLWAYLGFLHINGRKIDAQNYTGAKHPYIPGKLCYP